jgi:DNA-binding MltR family transcriptional regulator
MKLVERKYPGVTIQRVQRACYGNKEQKDAEFSDAHVHIEFLRKLSCIKELAPVPWLRQASNLIDQFQSVRQY